MRLAWKLALAAVALLVVLLAINTVVVNSQTETAAQTVPEAEIMELPGGTIQVADTGEPRGGAEGPPVVLLHCYACSLSWWDDVTEELEDERRVVRVDMLGFGGSDKPASGYSIEAQASVVANALNELGVEASVAVGHSLGGGVAVSLAEQASELVDRVVLVGMAPNTDDYGGLPFLANLAMTPVIGQAMWRLAPDGAIRSGFDDAFAPDFDADAAFGEADRIVEDYRAMTYTSSVETRRALADYTRSSPLDQRLLEVAVPAMVIFGPEDEISHAAPSLAAYERVPGLRTVEVPGTGHSPNVEDPERVAALILGFSEDVPVAGTRGG